MRTPRARSATASLLAVAVLSGGALVGCGGDDSPSPFAAQRGEAEATTDLGIPTVATRNTTRTATNDPVTAAAAVARATFSGGADNNRAKAVAIVDKGDWRAALAATALVADPVGAPLLFSAGRELPQATTDAVGALRPSGSEAAGGAQAIRIGDVGRPSGLRTTDLAGGDAAELALAIDRFVTAARGRTSTRVLVVSADHPEFAAPAASWLAKSGDAVAFVTGKGVPAATQRQLAAHPRATIYVLGPTTVVGKPVTRALREYGTVRRVGGTDAVSNSVGFARYGDGSFGWNFNEPGHGFTFARADDVLGAITLAPLSAHGLHGPLLLLDRADALPSVVRDYLLDVQPGYERDPARGRYNRGWLTGDTGAISTELQSQLDGLLEISPVRTATTPQAAPAPAPTATTSTTPTPSPEAGGTAGTRTGTTGGR
ncbi:hypothetical protein ACVU7I_08375 [Patulibacter sp. S7RM1-6]